MDIFSAIKDESSKKNLEAIMNGEVINNTKPIKKKKHTNKNDQLRNERRLKHLEEYHFKSGDELFEHIRRGKKAFRGGEIGWITIEPKDPNMVISFQKNEVTGKMCFQYETVDVFKAYIKTLDSNLIDGYIDFWHKKKHESKKPVTVEE